MSSIRNGMPATELTSVAGVTWLKSRRSGPTCAIRGTRTALHSSLRIRSGRRFSAAQGTASSGGRTAPRHNGTASLIRSSTDQGGRALLRRLA